MPPALLHHAPSAPSFSPSIPSNASAKQEITSGISFRLNGREGGAIVMVLVQCRNDARRRSRMEAIGEMSYRSTKLLLHDAGAARRRLTGIERDTMCLKCGYNLRGLVSSGACPECGTSTGLSLRGNLLRFGDPAWVASLAGGGRLSRSRNPVADAAVDRPCVYRLCAGPAGRHDDRPQFCYLVADLCRPVVGHKT